MEICPIQRTQSVLAMAAFLLPSTVNLGGISAIFITFSFCFFLPPLLRAVTNTSSVYYPHRLHQIVRRLALLIHIPPSSLAYLHYDSVMASIAAINTVVAGIEL